jgi:hypothetical protein
LVYHFSDWSMMVTAVRFSPANVVPAQFDAIKHGLDYDTANDVIIFYGNAGKASAVAANHAGVVVAIQPKIRRSGR